MAFDYQKLESETPHSWNTTTGEFDRRFAFSRQTSFNQQQQQPHTPPVSIISSKKPFLSRNSSKIDIFQAPKVFPKQNEYLYGGNKIWTEEESFGKTENLFKVIRLGSRPMKRLVMLISLNVACSTAELLIGLLLGQAGIYIYLFIYATFYIVLIVFEF